MNFLFWFFPSDRWRHWNIISEVPSTWKISSLISPSESFKERCRDWAHIILLFSHVARRLVHLSADHQFWATAGAWVQQAFHAVHNELNQQENGHELPRSYNLHASLLHNSLAFNTCLSSFCDDLNVPCKFIQSLRPPIETYAIRRDWERVWLLQ